ncbi:NAD-dependent histone deacetylase SIR2 [Pyrenophora tritici-repentis]|uniref:SIR2 family histone deacetylase (Hst4) n=1 Tax=Pyrenophora tritici-repentis (strain Pt-1C-BFP) TaxID=426418 RepID=B2W2W5_PYRTR|nr:SIR2 family histone deacetylase (Hst4) [Pyrenophora tritici-repentis Pt-1C-BFP]EDU46601.1 SIR2 family histone deacetylase (Hst4) [Pyrenophora tritici-repentis Pt-1C-BFP]KAA8619374.1 NAD-dependent histone deacetylase SIR2 [Pyrenophora tritici-repentis]PWO20540.1 membrane protein [Pyrenophora tritici-repentis]
MDDASPATVPEKEDVDASDGRGNKLDSINHDDDKNGLRPSSSFLFPILVEDDSIPHSGPSLSQNNPSLREIVQDKNKIVFITGAGISTSAGVDDFQSRSRTKMSSRNMLDISAIWSEEFLSWSRALYNICSKAQPTPFHHFLDELASTSRLLRHYTQNIDCLDTSLHKLSSRTISLHGRLDTFIYTMCHEMKHVPFAVYDDTFGFPCEECRLKSERRKSGGKRGLPVGVWRPKILLYGEVSPDAEEIAATWEQDALDNVDAVVLVGTRLKIPHTRKLAYSLCRSSKSRGGTVIWMNRVPLESEPTTEQPPEVFGIDHVTRGAQVEQSRPPYPPPT